MNPVGLDRRDAEVAEINRGNKKSVFCVTANLKKGEPRCQKGNAILIESESFLKSCKTLLQRRGLRL